MVALKLRLVMENGRSLLLKNREVVALKEKKYDINTDEMNGFIMRECYEKDSQSLSFSEVTSVINAFYSFIEREQSNSAGTCKVDDRVQEELNNSDIVTSVERNVGSYVATVENDNGDEIQYEITKSEFDRLIKDFKSNNNGFKTRLIASSIIKVKGSL